MNPALLERLQAVAAEAEAAGHGGKSAVYATAAAEMGMSVATLQRKLKMVVPTTPRKRRSDAGSSCMTKAEARRFAAFLQESRRKTGKRLMSFEDAAEILRSNGEISAGRTDEETGEFIPLCAASISRALHRYNLHPDQLGQPEPAINLRSKHPNHVWQIDPSLCVLYYMPHKTGECVQVMEEDKFYKNKPANIRKVEKERVWRYVITDHASGVIYVHYVLGAESGKNLVEAFITATQQRAGFPFHGIPVMAMVDPGSANTGAVFRNLCHALGVHLQVNKPGQPRAKGQVENGNNLVERGFESRIRFMPEPPTNLDELNACGWRWMHSFNSQKVHSRTGRPRYAVWMTISPEQLILAPDAQVMRELAVQAPVRRTVKTDLTIPFNGQSFSVADIPGVLVGGHLMVTRNPWREEAVQVIYTDDEGREVMQVLDPITQDQYGFNEAGAMIGEEYKSHADTVADTERKAIERDVMDADTDKEAEEKRKRKVTPFGGRIDPMKPIDETPLPQYLPRRGTELELDAPQVDMPLLNHYEMAKRLRGRMGDQWLPEHYQWIQARYPDGATEEQIEAIAGLLTRKQTTPLKVVG